MDLGAFVRIRGMKQLADLNEINVPRTRGYRWMAAEKPVTEEEMADLRERIETLTCDDAPRTEPMFSLSPMYTEFSLRTSKLVSQYMDVSEKEVTDGNGRKYKRRVVKPDWNKITGQDAENLKIMLRNAVEQLEEQYSLFNEYAGKEGVLYVHARIGTKNGTKYKWTDLMDKPWFIAGTDDAFDDTYCDIYARVKEIPPEIAEKLEQLKNRAEAS